MDPFDAFTPAAAQVALSFAATADGEDDPLVDLSAAMCIGDTLFLGSDEGDRLERLLWDGERWAGHERVCLRDLLPLEQAGEADIEGLAHERREDGGGWLWVVGSHARARPKIKAADGCIDVAALAELKDTRPRCLLARLSLVEEAPGRWRLEADGATMLKQNKHGNALAEALADDPLIGPFTRVAAKEGGLDVEGIAVAGERVALGLRGPVIRTYAVLLEMQVVDGKEGRLKLDGPLHKRLLDLGGLGIRDLKRRGGDLLILAGPTTSLDGPSAVHLWRGWADDPPQHDTVVRLHKPERIIQLPFGRNCQHAEGLALVERDGRTRLLVVNDTPDPATLGDDRRSVRCDLFDLPD